MRQFSIHPSALCESNDIGRDRCIGAFTDIAHKVRVGQNCVIGPHVVLGRDVVIGEPSNNPRFGLLRQE